MNERMNDFSAVPLQKTTQIILHIIIIVIIPYIESIFFASSVCLLNRLSGCTNIINLQDHTN